MEISLKLFKMGPGNMAECESAYTVRHEKNKQPRFGNIGLESTDTPGQYALTVIREGAALAINGEVVPEEELIEGKSFLICIGDSFDIPYKFKNGNIYVVERTILD